jgi:hypothetical protein
MHTLVDAGDEIAFPGQALNLPGAEGCECCGKQYQAGGEDRAFDLIVPPLRLFRVSLAHA